jgi:hypothetical protein
MLYFQKEFELCQFKASESRVKEEIVSVGSFQKETFLKACFDKFSAV